MQLPPHLPNAELLPKVPLVDTADHLTQSYIVDIDNYLYLVPFVTDPDGTIFLKTIIPSRKSDEGIWEGVIP